MNRHTKRVVLSALIAAGILPTTTSFAFEFPKPAIIRAETPKLIVPRRDPIIAQAGSTLLLGAGKSTVAANPTRTYAGVTTGTIATTVITGTNCPISTATSDRVVVAILHKMGTDGAINSATIGGTTANLVANQAAQNGSFVGFIWLLVTAGTTSTIVFNMSLIAAGGDAVIETYSLYGLSSNTPTGSMGVVSASQTILNGTLNVSAGGIVLASAGQYANGSNTVAITATDAVTTDHNDFHLGGYSWGDTGSIANATGNASYSVTATWNVAGNCALGAAAWR